jgi:hypothetical protein
MDAGAAAIGTATGVGGGGDAGTAAAAGAAGLAAGAAAPSSTKFLKAATSSWDSTIMHTS